jgi:RNA polymerase sigma-70 factor (ECF subfamily)
MSDDQQVIQCVLDGDVEAFRMLVVKYQRPLVCLVRNLMADPHEGEDVAQEAFLTAFARLRSYDPERASFLTWLLTIARNRCLNARKKKRPLPLAELPEGADARTPEVEAVEEEFFAQLDAGLAALPFEQQTVFVLSEIQGYSHEEIGRIEGVKPGTVKSRLSRAKEKLRSLLPWTAEQT